MTCLLDEQEQAVALVLDHLTRIIADARERQLFINWLAWVVQHPGRKIRWSPYLCGVQGDGKSFFGVLLGLVVGASNYRTMSGELLNGSTFTDWAVGQCVTLIEEVKLTGPNRFDAANKIEPYITNDAIDVHPKGRAPYTAPNTTQYLIASNHLDGMPVTDDDRRFMFLQTAYSTASLKAFKAAQPDFYKRLFTAIHTYPGAMRYWLMHYADWHPDFDPDGNAPHTTMRGLVIAMSESDLDAACQTVWAEKPGGVTDSWVAVACFVSAVSSQLGPHSGLKPAQIKRFCAEFLRSMGYRYMGDERHRVGPERVPSRFWCHEKVCQSDLQSWHNWWETAEPAMNESFAGTAPKSFLV
ncbi:primase-helicase family protein [Paraburkholderia sp. BR13439]|uniref:primase-helicase family protein n=1 Tax=Paraburkholderia sp. BR13439 TaxID=3236996 RepID=UPI0034CE8FCD